MRVTIMYLLHFLLMKRNHVIFDLRNFLVDADQNATFPLLIYLRLIQFSYTKIGNFFDRLTDLTFLSHLASASTFLMILYL